MVLVDLQLPKLDGFDLLRWIRRQDTLRHVPLVVFASSHLDRDVAAAYEFGANSYVRKPLQLAEYDAALELLTRYWCTMNRAARPRCRDDGWSIDERETMIFGRGAASCEPASGKN
jgi:DNA-binding response OmpR family regulator